MILVDSSVWIAYLSRAPSPEKDLLEQLLQQPLLIATSGLIVCEVLQGLREERQRNLVHATLTALRLLPEPSFETYVRSADMYRHARKRGLTIRSTIDCILAAQAIEARASILHKDRDFAILARVSTLKIHRG